MNVLIILLIFLGGVRCNLNINKEPVLVSDEFAKHIANDNKKIKVAWHTEDGDLLINEEYINSISEPEKAVLAYAVVVYEQLCGEHKGKSQGKELGCEMLSMLNLESKCSANHLNFLSEWYKGDDETLTMIHQCTILNNTSIRQVALRELYITTSKSTISLLCKVSSININKPNYLRKWSVEEVFEVKNEQIKLIDRNVIHGMNK